MSTAREIVVAWQRKHAPSYTPLAQIDLLHAIDAALQARERATWQAASQAIPANWLDPLLTGDRAVLGAPPYDCPDIERLLRAIAAALAQRAGGA